MKKSIEIILICLSAIIYAEEVEYTRGYIDTYVQEDFYVYEQGNDNIIRLGEDIDIVLGILGEPLRELSNAYAVRYFFDGISVLFTQTDKKIIGIFFDDGKYELYRGIGPGDSRIDIMTKYQNPDTDSRIESLWGYTIPDNNHGPSYEIYFYFDEENKQIVDHVAITHFKR